MSEFLDLAGLQRYHNHLVDVVPVVDNALSDTSTNAVQNKVVTESINNINTTLGDVQSVLDTVLNGG